MNGPLMEQITDRLLAMQGQESFDLRLLKKQLKEAEKGIENMLNAIQMGIITPSTKQRLAGLEEQKNQLEQQILMEQIKNPVLFREQIAFFIDQYRKTDIHDEAQRQRLIDCFVNAVFVYDDKIVLTFNYKDGAKTIVLDDVNGSDMVDNGPPRQTAKPRLCSLVLPKKKMRIRIPREKARDVLQSKYISGLVRFPGAL